MNRNSIVSIIAISVAGCAGVSSQVGAGMLDAVFDVGANINYHAQSSGQSIAGSISPQTKQVVTLRNPDVPNSTATLFNQAQDEYGRFVCAYTSNAVILMPFGEFCPPYIEGVEPRHS